MSTREVLRWAIQRHYPQLALTTGVLRAGRENWHTFLQQASVEERIALLVRIETWQRLEAQEGISA